MSINEEIPVGYYGAITETPPDSVFQIVGGGFNVPIAKNRYSGIQYNQLEVQANSCTLHGAIGALSDLWSYTFTLDERLAIYQLALKAGFDPSIGWYVSKAVDLVRNWWNAKYPDKAVMSFFLPLVGLETTDAKQKGYSLVCSFDGNASYNQDKSDGVLDGIAFGNATYGHCVREVKLDVGHDEIIDNYPQSKVETYQVPIGHEQMLVTNKVFSFGCYIFVVKADWDALNTASNLPLWAQASWSKAVNKGILTGDPNKQLSVQDIENTLIKLKDFSAAQGNITAARWAVALDRMNQL